jgi:hypothetical protein
MRLLLGTHFARRWRDFRIKVSYVAANEMGPLEGWPARSEVTYFTVTVLESALVGRSAPT